MSNKLVYIVAFFLLFTTSHAQKRLEKSWDANEFSSLEIRSNAVYAVYITTEDISSIHLTTIIEGETHENLLLNISTKNKVLRIGTGYTPYFEAKNDKLAAHKVLAIEMYLRIPKKLNVSVISSLASLKLTGEVSNIETRLEIGSCSLFNFKGNANLQSNLGDIYVEAREGVGGQAYSKNGTSTNFLSKSGKFMLYAESVKGDISLQRSQ